MTKAAENKMICIAGKNDVACDALLFLVQNEIVSKDNIVVVPNASTQKQIAGMKDLSETAQTAGITVIEQLPKLYECENLFFFSLEYDRLIDPRKFKTNELFNIHFSKLPAYKGMYTSAWPILNGQDRTGVTLHKIDRGIDTGDIIDQREFPIEFTDTCRTLYFKYNRHGFELFKSNIRNILDKKYSVRQQPFCGSSYYSKASISYHNLTIDLNKTAYEVYNQIRAFTFPEYQLPRIHGYTVAGSEILNNPSTVKAGDVVVDEVDYLILATVDYDIKVLKKN